MARSKLKKKGGKESEKSDGPRDLWEEWGSVNAGKNKQGVYEFI